MYSVIVYFKDCVDGQKFKAYKAELVDWEDGVFSMSLTDKWVEAVHIPLTSIQYWTQKKNEPDWRGEASNAYN